MKLLTKFQDYDIIDNWTEPSAEVTQKVIDLWKRNSILPAGAAAEERAKQVVLAALNAEGKAVGVNTVYEGHFPHAPEAQDRVSCYFYRMFIEPAHRRPHLMRVMTTSAFDVLQTARPKDGPQSFIIITENPGLTGPGMLRLFERFGYRVWRKTPRGQLVIRRDFAPKEASTVPSVA
jgi:hypothetical protein